MILAASALGQLPPLITCPPDVTIECTQAPVPSLTGVPSATSQSCIVNSVDGITGSLTSDDPTTTLRVELFTDACSEVSTLRYYDIWHFTISETDTYIFSGMFTGDGMGAIYQDVFDPDNPCDNYIAGNDDDGPGPFDPLVITSLMSPGDYVLVSTTYGELTTMDYDWSFASVGDGFIFPDMPLTFQDQYIPGSCNGEGIIERTWFTEDCVGSVSCVQSITVTDNTPPVINCAPDVTIACDQPLPPVQGVTAIDGCDFPDPFCDVPTGLPGFPTDADCEAAICAADPFCCSVSWDAICADAAVTEPACCDCLQEPTCAVFCDQATGSPGFPSDPACEAAICAADPFCCSVTWDGICADAAAAEPACCDCIEQPTCDPSVTVSFVDSAPSGQCPAVITRTYTATDDCGNTSTCTQNIHIEDTVAPTIICPPDATIECSESNSPIVLGSATAEDICDLAPTVGYADSFQQVCGTSGTLTRTWTATDACGNTSTCNQIITIVDTTPPDLFVPADITVECPSDTDPAISGQASALDNCGTPSLEYTDFYCATEGFTGDYDLTNWVITAPNGGSVATNPDVVLTSPNGVPCVDQSTQLSIVIPENGKISFGWNYTTSDVDGPSWDPFGYSLNGSFEQLTDDAGGNMQSGTAFVLVSAGDIFAFDASSVDCQFGSAATTVIEFFVYDCADAPPPGVFWPTDIDRCWAAVDACGNTTLGIQHITIQDLELPSAICNQALAIPLNNEGMATIPAEVFDGGSSDNCGEVFFKVRRMDPPNGYDCFTNDNDQYQFDDKVKFCCEDIANNEIMVVLRVYEHEPDPGIVSDDHLQGHFADCMAMVEVQDKMGPQVTCPPDLTVSCIFPFDPDNLDVFGTVVTDPGLQQQVCLDDPGNTLNPGFQCYGLDGLATDNCNVTIDTTISMIFDTICETGSILRTWVVTDDGGLTATCQQSIEIINFEPFQESDINWPPDTTITDVCQVDLLDPEDLPPPYNEPTFVTDACDLVTFNYEDIVFDFSNPNQACFKILRTWRVIDWCSYNISQQSTGLFEMVQVIKVINTTGPTIAPLEDQVVCTDDPGCGPGNILLLASATDDCTAAETLAWRVSIDLDNDGSLNEISQEIIGATIQYPAVLPLGIHRILYSVWDFCGNLTTMEQLIDMRSCKPPSAKCHGLATTLMDMGDDGMVAIWASEMDAGSDHVCGNPVTVAFSADPTDVTRTFTCADLGPNPVELWVIDNNGNTDFCIDTIVIQDNMMVCDGDPGVTGTIAGEITTSVSQAMNEVMVELQGSGLQPEYTHGQGEFMFPSMPLGGNYTVRPELDVDPTNGVSTIDLIRIQKHLLGIQQFDSPYLHIAADANRSGHISAVDILNLKKLILGIVDSIPGNTSWRFVNAAYEFDNPDDPLVEAFPEFYEISPFMNDMMDVDFIGVKVGDVNGSATVAVNPGEPEVVSGRQEAKVLILDRGLKAGEIYTIPVSGADLDRIETMQFTLQWANSDVEVLEVRPGMRAGHDQWNDQLLEHGLLPFSWHRLENPNRAEGSELFVLEVRAKRDLRLSEIFGIGSVVTPEEASARGIPMPVELNYTAPDATDDGAFTLYQNVPNPFDNTTVIPFDSPKDGTGVLVVHDLLGRTIYREELGIVKGYNEVQLKTSQLGVSGVLIYTVRMRDLQQSRRMIIDKE